MDHTRGPWIYLPEVFDDKGHFEAPHIFGMDRNGEPRIVAEIAVRGREEQHANGLILGAALELLEALKGLAADVEKVARDSFSTADGPFDEDYRTEDPDGYAAWSAARAAIAKAEGRP